MKNENEKIKIKRKLNNSKKKQYNFSCSAQISRSIFDVVPDQPNGPDKQNARYQQDKT